MQKLFIMKNYRSLLLLLFVLVQSLTFAQLPQKRTYYADEGIVPREHLVDFQHLLLKIQFEPEEKTIHAEVKHTFKVLQQTVDSVVLDAINMDFKKVLVDGKKAKYENTGEYLIIYFDKTLNWETEHSLTIEYTAKPKKGMYFIGWNDPTHRSRKQIWTQGQGIDNRHWIPMYDTKNDKVVSEIIADFDEKYRLVSNGKLLSEEKIKNGQKRWHYKISHPHPTYLIMLAIGEYEIERRTSDSGVEMDLYYYPDHPEQVEPTYRFSKRMFDLFEKEIGVPYPWTKYSQIPVQDFMYGAMENTTATIYGDFYLVDERTYPDRNYVRVNAHELAHQWFGDMVTARSDAHHWLQESFATHFDLMYQQVAFGDDEYNWVRRRYNNTALEASKSNFKGLANSTAGSARFYPKGAFVLQMLKYVVGKESFNKAVKYYLEKHDFGNVDSKDLLVAFHESQGLSLDWFWEDWIYKGGEPFYEVSFNQYGNKGIFNVEQVHDANELVGLFKMPIIFQVFYKDGTKDEKTVLIEKQSHQVIFDLPADKKVDFMLFDPNSEVMKKLTFPKTVDVLKAQAQKAKHMIDRYDAIVALGEMDFEGKTDFLLKRFEEENFYGIKNEIAQQIIPLLDENAEKLIQSGLNHGDAKVKAHILDNTIRISASMEKEYKKLLDDSSYVVIEKTLNLLSFYFPQNIEEYLKITQGVQGDRSHNVAITHLKIAYESTLDKKYIKQLVDYTSVSFEFLTRINAAKALKELNYLDEEALGNLLEASFSFNARLRGPILTVLNYFFEQSKYKRLMVQYVSNHDWEDEEFQSVSKYIRP